MRLLLLHFKIFATFDALGTNLNTTTLGEGGPLKVRIAHNLTNRVVLATKFMSATSNLRAFVANGATSHRGECTNIWGASQGVVSFSYMADPAGFVFQIAVLVLSVVIHEVSHGTVALALGDPTAKYAGRLTLNPIPHVDPMGSFVLPLLLGLSGLPIIGWAKPVPYNPYNLRNQRAGPVLVALAGPLSNIIIAAVFGFVASTAFASGGVQGQLIASAAALVVVVNVALGIFNLIPIPPLDGSKLLLAVIPDRFYGLKNMLEQYGFILLLIFIFTVSGVLSPVIRAVAGFFLGGAA